MADWRWWQWLLALWGGVAVARILASTIKSPEQTRAEAELWAKQERAIWGKSPNTTETP